MFILGNAGSAKTEIWKKDQLVGDLSGKLTILNKLLGMILIIEGCRAKNT